MNNIIFNHYCAIAGELKDSLLKSENLYQAFADVISDGIERGNISPDKSIEAEARFLQHTSSLIESIELLAPGTVPPLQPPAKSEEWCLKLYFYRCLLEKLDDAVNILISRCQSADEKSKPQCRKVQCCKKKPADDLIRSAKPAAETLCRITVCGGRRTGKTSLIKAVTPEGVVPESAVNFRSCENSPSAVYRSGVLIFKEPENGTETVCRKNKLSAERDQADCIWYCIDGAAGTVCMEDIEKIKAYGEKVLVIVTKSELMRKESILPLMSELLKSVRRDRLVIVSSESGTGLCRLWEKSWQIIGDAQKNCRKRWERSCSMMKKQWQEIADCEAERYISWNANPSRQSAGIAEMEEYMICKLAGIYGAAVEQTEIDMLRQCGSGITVRSGWAAKLYFGSDMSISADELKRKSRRFRC